MDQASGGVAEMMMLMTEKVKVKVKMVKMRMRMRMKRHLENERVDEHTSVV